MVISNIKLFLTILLSGFITLCAEKRQNFSKIAGNLGYPINEYDVITQDSYILKLFHIPGDRKRPVLLMHGIIDSADTFIIRGNSSLATTLARAGYDVWIGNSRGNRYSRRHIYLDPDKDKEFWDFSFHETAIYDLPALIDHILLKTGQLSLSAIGHSQGNSIFLALGAMKPEYNMKIKILISLSPICFLNNLKNVPFVITRTVPFIDILYRIMDEEEFLGDNTSVGHLFRAVCNRKDSYVLCAYGILFPMAGRDPGEFEPDFLPTVIAHYPTGTSKKNTVHLSQIAKRRKFAEYDYERNNVNVYGSSSPPDYDLNKVTMKIALLAGRNDLLSTLKDVDLLRTRLPNVVMFKVIDHKKFNHIDAVWGKHMDQYLFPVIFKVLEEYS